MKRKLDELENTATTTTIADLDADETQHDILAHKKSKLTTIPEDRDEALLKLESSGPQLLSSNQTSSNPQQKLSIQNMLKRAYSSKKTQSVISNSSSNNNGSDSATIPGSSSLTGTLAKNGREQELSRLCDIPIDWSLGSTIRFTADKSFSWVSHLTDLAKTVAVRSFVSRQRITSQDFVPSQNVSMGCSQQHQSCETSSLDSVPPMPPNLSFDVCSDLYRALLYYQFPASQLPSSVKDKMKALSLTNIERPITRDEEYLSSGTDREQLQKRQELRPEDEFSLQGYQIFENILQDDASFLNERMQNWCDSMSSVYTLFNNGDCPYFYITREDRLSVMFVCCGVGSMSPVRAIVSSSTPDMFKQKLSDSSIEFQRQVDSSFLFIGRKQVHALFSYLLMDCVRHVSSDFPTIVAPVSFMNAALKSLRTTQNQSFSKFSKKQQKEQQMFSLEFSGHILPHAKISLCKTIARALASTTREENNASAPVFSVSFQTDKLSSYFNIQNTEEENLVSTQSSQASQALAQVGKCTWIASLIKRSNDSSMESDDILSCLKPDQAFTVPEMNKCYISKIHANRTADSDICYTIKLVKLN